ncbi:P-loop containing nucleoside triphosphate hydrolase protein [Mucidula mucida]|nr:P-loop containing nucleoside triphosphate hydrolase protein [Mucidula mucida]
MSIPLSRALRLRGERIQGLSRHHSTKAVVHIPKANIYRFGDASRPVFRDVNWTVNENENWAVISSASHEKHDLFQTLLGHLRISPYPPPPEDPRDQISIVSFGNRRRASSGAFYDYTARYGAVQDEHRVTLRQHMFPETIDPFGGIPEELRDPAWKENQMNGADSLSPERHALFDSLVQKMGLSAFLDLPLIALSNGQTPGLDVKNRPNLLNLLHNLHSTQSPRVILGLRLHDPVPDWITHVALLRGTSVKTGLKHHILSEEALRATSEITSTPPLQSRVGDIVVDMKNIKVQYQDRKVIQNLNWQIRQGERWHLQGENGSGKTTLLSLLTGDHPQIPTPHLQSLIGVLSPEMFDAFPRRAGMSVWDVVGTGFDGTFVPRGRHAVGTGVMRELTEGDVIWRRERCAEVIAALGPPLCEARFCGLGVGEQRMVLLMRALVGRPQLVLLDEVWSGMDERMVTVAKRYLREGGGIGDDQAVVVITHWDDEVPWRTEDGVKRIRLEKGEPTFF